MTRGRTQRTLHPHVEGGEFGFGNIFKSPADISLAEKREKFGIIENALTAKLKSIFGNPFTTSPSQTGRYTNINGFVDLFGKLFNIQTDGTNYGIAVRSGAIRNVQEYNKSYDPTIQAQSGEDKKFYLPEHVVAKKTVLGRIILFDFQFQADTKHRIVLVTGWRQTNEYALILFNMEGFIPTVEIHVKEQNGAKVLNGLPKTGEFTTNTAQAKQAEPAATAATNVNSAQQVKGKENYGKLTAVQKTIFNKLGLDTKYFTPESRNIEVKDSRYTIPSLLMYPDVDIIRVIEHQTDPAIREEMITTLLQYKSSDSKEDCQKKPKEKCQVLTDWELRNYDSARLDDISSIEDLKRYEKIYPSYYEFIKYHDRRKNYIKDKNDVRREGIEPKNYLPGRWKDGTKGITKSGWFGNLFSSKGSTVKEDGAKAKVSAATAATATFSTEGATQVSRVTDRGLWNKIKGDLPTDAMYSHAGFLCTVLTHLSKVDAGHIKIWDDALQQLVVAPKKVRPEISPECATHVRDDLKNYKLLAKQYNEIMDVINEIRNAKPGADEDDGAKAKKKRNAKLVELRDKVCAFEDRSKEIARIVREIKSDTKPIINTTSALNSKTEAKRAERAKIIYDAAYKKINESIVARANAIKVRLDAKDMKALAAKVDEIVKSRSSNSPIDAKEYARVTKELDDIDKKIR
jgi:hypothetical protein